ncbi:lipoate--protein ligase [Flavobacterium agricola]|uniref:lipoate--protein ligase n=1 Tax=Flavobacterium agricola TaxID=2870839 RepID=A0ABY6M1R6_9FLAO|nr:lipoate--protein ligase [Flavobacterium agricola]UYW02493.1 lipoate--protein ligase [Flavobacterium agricola]
MVFIDNQGITDPSINLAIEEFAVRYLPANPPILLFYINKPSIIIGKNQNTIEEINTNYVADNNIQVVRRLSGGGAVYHDEGNLNFSFITENDGKSFSDFKKFLNPIVEALAEMGIEAEVKGRNDILINDKKISGNAQFATMGKIFTHGTLLFNSDIDEVVNALKVRKDKIESKGMKSVRSRVANISEFLSETITISEFKQKILTSIFKTSAINQIPEYHLTDEDWKKIYEIRENRYANWDWNYGKSPISSSIFSKRFPSGVIDIHLNLKQGMIEDIKIYGDFFGIGEVSDIENMLRNKKYDREELKATLKNVNITHYFGAITLDDFMNVLY